jgi:hypothetical protein
MARRPLSSLPSADDAFELAPSPSPGPAKVSYTHEAMIDLLLTRPGITQNELAEAFGYTPAWVSRIMVSDAFRAKLAERRAEIIDPEVRDRAKKNFEAIVLRSQDLLMEKLNASATQVSDATVLRALDISSKAIGYGARAEVLQPVAINVDQHLTVLGENLTKMLRQRREEVEDGVVEGEVVETQQREDEG